MIKVLRVDGRGFENEQDARLYWNAGGEFELHGSEVRVTWRDFDATDDVVYIRVGKKLVILQEPKQK